MSERIFALVLHLAIGGLFLFVGVTGLLAAIHAHAWAEGACYAVIVLMGAGTWLHGLDPKGHTHGSSDFLDPH